MNRVNEILGKPTYKKLLQSDEWKEFSRSIREQINFCHYCKRADVRLEIHHLFYDYKRKPWEYKKEEVIVICSTCHTEIHKQLEDFRKYVFRYLSPQTFRVLNGSLAVAMTHYDPLVFVHALSEFVSNPRLIETHSKAWSNEKKNSKTI